MAKVISLSEVRKARAKAAKKGLANANASKFGRSKAQKTKDQKDADRAKSKLDQHERE